MQAILGAGGYCISNRVWMWRHRWPSPTKLELDGPDASPHLVLWSHLSSDVTNTAGKSFNQTCGCMQLWAIPESKLHINFILTLGVNHSLVQVVANSHSCMCPVYTAQPAPRRDDNNLKQTKNDMPSNVS